MRVVYSRRFLDHSQGIGHPESPERLKVILEALDKSGRDFVLIEPNTMDPRELETVHARGHIQVVEKLSATGSLAIDNKFNPNTFGLALLAASASYEAARGALDGEGFGTALVRPPGHHSGRNSFAGFCYFNNIAFAIRKAMVEKKAGRAVIVDMDAHHGNGTQEIFYNDERVFFISLHMDPHGSYPGTGFDSENNGHVYNVPLAKETGDAGYLKALAGALDKAGDFGPDIVGISAGFDTWGADPVGGLGIREAKTYFEAGRMVEGAFGCPKFACLEGGYDIASLGNNVLQFLGAFR